MRGMDFLKGFLINGWCTNLTKTIQTAAEGRETPRLNSVV